MAFYVYKITNTLSGKVYIGKAKDVHLRWKRHLTISRSSKGPKKYLHHCIKKYGEESFKVETVGDFSSEKEAFEAEVLWISKLQADNPAHGMNLTKGGEGPTGFKHSEETKQKLSTHSGWTHTPESKERISKAHKGKRVSETTRQKLRQAFTGRTLSEEVKAKLSAYHTKASLGSGNGFFGKTHSKSTKEKLRAQMVGHNSPRAKFTQEQVRDIRELYASGEHTLQELADLYDCSISGIYGVTSKRRYQDS